MNTAKDFKTVEEIAQLLRLNPITVYGFIRRGEFPALKIGRSYRIEWNEFLNFLEKHKTNI